MWKEKQTENNREKNQNVPLVITKRWELLTNDLLISFVECVCKTRWCRKLFVRVLDMSVLNSYNLSLVKAGKKSHICCNFDDQLYRNLWRHFRWIALWLVVVLLHYGGGCQKGVLWKVTPTASNQQSWLRCQVYSYLSTKSNPVKNICLTTVEHASLEKLS